jgi:hypothetical protein
MHLRTHFDRTDTLCPPVRYGETRTLYVHPEPDPNQLALFEDAV